MIPTMGRIVFYQRSKYEGPVNGSFLHPAIITASHGNGLVNLQVFSDGLGQEVKMSVLEIPDSFPHESPPETPGWFWPPRN